MQVHLMNPEGVNEGLFNTVRAACLCVGKFFAGNEVDAVRHLRDLIEQQGDEAAIEHLVFTFHIKGISQACLKELVRQRGVCCSVKSTRYPLKDLLNGGVNDFRVGLDQFSSDQQKLILNTMSEIQGVLAKAVPNKAQECFATEVWMTINLRSFRNLVSLRTVKRAHEEIRELTNGMVKALPLALYPLIADCLT